MRRLFATDCSHFVSSERGWNSRVCYHFESSGEPCRYPEAISQGIDVDASRSGVHSVYELVGEGCLTAAHNGRSSGEAGGVCHAAAVPFAATVPKFIQRQADLFDAIEAIPDFDLATQGVASDKEDHAVSGAVLAAKLVEEEIRQSRVAGQFRLIFSREVCVRSEGVW